MINDYLKENNIRYTKNELHIFHSTLFLLSLENFLSRMVLALHQPLYSYTLNPNNM